VLSGSASIHTQPILTNRHDFDKTETASAIDLDNRRQSPVATILGMPAKPSQPALRRSRTDAPRNRERFLEVAQEAFARSRASTSLDDVTKQAGVGAGTLYRHFPTRDTLLEAVHRTKVEKLAAAERKLAQDLAPIEALRAWMLLFVGYIATKQPIAPARNTLVGAPSKVYETSRAPITRSVHALVERATESSDIPMETERAPDECSRMTPAPMATVIPNQLG
jgi:AcrR family transcriptional regulator